MGHDEWVPDRKDKPEIDNGNGYALSGKIMLSAIVILFFVVILMVCLHLYARWYLIRARRRQLRRRNRHRRNQHVFYVDTTNTGAANVVHDTRGLDASVLMSLPVFVFSSKTHPNTHECAVCLSEFEENETGRILPKCNHSFHIECIDMWFHSHSTCPLCRSPVEPCQILEVSVPAQESEAAAADRSSSSELCAACQQVGEQSIGASTSSFGDRRKRVDVRIEVPTRNASFGGESGTGSPASSHSFRSPMSRMLSFTRILSRDRRPGPSPSASCVGTTINEPDVERGRDETQQSPS